MSFSEYFEQYTEFKCDSEKRANSFDKNYMSHLRMWESYFPSFQDITEESIENIITDFENRAKPFAANTIKRKLEVLLDYVQSIKSEEWGESVSKEIENTIGNYLARTKLEISENGIEYDFPRDREWFRKKVEDAWENLSDSEKIVASHYFLYMGCLRSEIAHVLIPLTQEDIEQCEEENSHYYLDGVIHYFRSEKNDKKIPNLQLNESDRILAEKRKSEIQKMDYLVDLLELKESVAVRNRGNLVKEIKDRSATLRDCLKKLTKKLFVCPELTPEQQVFVSFSINGCRHLHLKSGVYDNNIYELSNNMAHAINTNIAYRAQVVSDNLSIDSGSSQGSSGSGKRKRDEDDREDEVEYIRNQLIHYHETMIQVHRDFLTKFSRESLTTD